MYDKVKQGAQISRRYRVMHYCISVEFFSTATRLDKKKSFLKRFAVGEWPWRSLKGIRFAAIWPAVHHFLLVFVVTTTPSCTVFEILPNLKCRWLRATLRSFFLSKRKLKLQATCAFRFICKHIVDNAYYISRGKGVIKVSDSKSDLQSHPRCHSIGHKRFPVRPSLPLQICLYLAPFPRYYHLFPPPQKKRSRDRKHIPLTKRVMPFIWSIQTFM